MGSTYLVADINEKSGRHVLGRLENGKLKLEEVYRFEVKHIQKDTKKLWDLEYIFEQIKTGIAKCKKLGRLPVLVGLTACDGCFVFIDKDNKVLDNMVFNFNSGENPEIFKSHYSDYIQRAKCFLALSDYFNYLLSGKLQCNYTNLLLPGWPISRDTMDWNEDNITRTGFDKSQFSPVVYPGSVIGNLTLEVTEEIGYDFILIQTLSRQKASAIFKMAEIPGPDDDENIKRTGNIQQTDKKRLTENIDAADELKSIIGCLSILMITSHELEDMEAAKACIRNTFYAG